MDEANGIYISKCGECTELFEYFQEETDTEFVEQASSSYIFSDVVNSYVISPEVYWEIYTVGTLLILILSIDRFPESKPLSGLESVFFLP